jgi:hypothetical protein
LILIREMKRKTNEMWDWNVKKKGWWKQNTLKDAQEWLLMYFCLCLRIDGIVVQSTAALSLIIGQHPPLIHHFHWRDLILIREVVTERKQTKMWVCYV